MTGFSPVKPSLGTISAKMISLPETAPSVKDYTLQWIQQDPTQIVQIINSPGNKAINAFLGLVHLLPLHWFSSDQQRCSTPCSSFVAWPGAESNTNHGRGAQGAAQPQPHPLTEHKPQPVVMMCLQKGCSQGFCASPCQDQASWAQRSLQPCTAERESSKLLRLDNSSDLQQHKSSAEQLQARLQ